MRSAAASVVGWVIVGLIVLWFLGAVVGTIAFIIRFAIWLVVIAVLVGLYLRLRSPD
jgi:hypothetical protein